MTPKAAVSVAAATLAALIALEGSSLAQYDRDGRYVPSPMGVPLDPYAAPIPMYPGTPGGAVGTPVLPRAAVPETPVVPPLRRDIPRAPPLYPNFVPLTLGQCGEPWSRATKVTPTEFRRRCASMLKHQEELKRKQERGSDLDRPGTLDIPAVGQRPEQPEPEVMTDFGRVAPVLRIGSR
jgi:hypothetical protein